MTGQRQAVIIGAGRIAGLNELDPARAKPCTHLGAIRASSSLEVAGVVDNDPERARSFATTLNVDKWGCDIGGMLAQVKPEVVTVAVPYAYQHDVVRQIVESKAKPKRLLLEKPLADNLDRGRDIVAMCKSAGIAVLVNNECAAPVYRQINDILTTRFRNEVISVTAWCSSGMHAIGIHVLGVMRLLFGKFAWVRAVQETKYVESLPFSNNFISSDPRIHAILVFQSGVTGFLTNSALTEYTYKELEVMCRSGTLRLSENGSHLVTRGTAIPGRSSISYRLADKIAEPVVPGTIFTEIGRWLDDEDIAAGQDVVGADISLDAFEAMHALIESAGTGREVHLEGSPA